MITEQDPRDEPTPIEPDSFEPATIDPVSIESAQPGDLSEAVDGAPDSAAVDRTEPAQLAAGGPEERPAGQKNAFCFSCGYERFNLESHEPCPACGKNPNSPRCTFCGYELVGLMVTQDCPECGKPIWDSNVQPPTSGLSIASMVLGIVSLVSCMLYGIPALVLGPLAIIFGEIANRQHKKGLRAGNTKGFALTGRICGWAGFAAGLTVVGLVVWAIMAGM